MSDVTCPPAPFGVFFAAALLRKGSNSPGNKLLGLLLTCLMLSACGDGSLSSGGSSGVRVSASPANATVVSGKTRQLTARVSNTRNTAVSWSATAGRVSSSGLFTAPRVRSTTQVRVTATSRADSRKSASVALTVNPAATVTRAPPWTGGGVRVSAWPSNAIIVSGKTGQFLARVSNTRNTAVTWSATAGTVSSSGLFTAPRVGSTTQVKVTATSQADSRGSASVALTVNPAATVPAAPGQHTVSLSWKGTTSSNVAKYNMYRSTVAGGYYGLLAGAIAGATYSDQSVQSGTIYYYVVTAVDHLGQESTYSNETQVTIP